MLRGASQQLIEIQNIREGTVILKDGGLRAVLMCSSVNFALKSEDEQKAIVFQFQNFLNSLDFHIQILVQSRKYNLSEYLAKLKALEEQQLNELLRLHTAEYREFIRGFIEGADIMQKAFYVTVSYDGVAAQLKKGFGFKGKLGEEEAQFEHDRTQLYQRVAFVIDGLRRTGIQTVPLNTKELIELLWSFYNPDEAEVGNIPEIPEEIY